jgi:peptidoglycan/xylan/chitin deacetylase (PgdA/CDA1 family)
MQVKPPLVLRFLLPGVTWKINTSEKVIFVTIDDGPHPEITLQVLEILDRFQAKATFFCVGDNVVKHPQTYREILARGHTTGNHTFNHLKGWTTNNKTYFENIEKAAQVIESNLFRPPYGKITPIQQMQLKKQYQLIMWSVISYDFRVQITPEQCLENVIKHSFPGTIAVFHDSVKAAKNMLATLPVYLEKMSEMGYQFKALQTG